MWTSARPAAPPQTFHGVFAGQGGFLSTDWRRISRKRSSRRGSEGMKNEDMLSLNEAESPSPIHIHPIRAQLQCLLERSAELRLQLVIEAVPGSATEGARVQQCH